MNSKIKSRFTAPIRRITSLRLISIVMLAAMLLGMLPTQNAVASADLSSAATALEKQKPAQYPVQADVPTPAPLSGDPGALALSEYPPPEIRKSDNPDPVAGSAPLTYTIHITNPLNNPVGGFVVTDTLPAGVIFDSATPSQGTCDHASGIVLCSLGSLNAQATATIIVNVTTPATPGVLTNLAEVVDARGEPVSTTQQTMVMPADLSITQTDLPDPAEWNQPLDYALTITNTGPYPAQNVIVTDTLPAGATFQSASTGCTHSNGVVTCSVGTLAVGANANLSITILAPPGHIVNQASVSALNPDPNPTDNLAQEWTAVQLVDLAIGKQAWPAFVLAGDPLTYTLVVTNQGSLVAPSVVITDRLPAEVAFLSASAGCVEGGGVITCTVGNLAPGASAEATIIVTPDALPPDGPLYSLQLTQNVLFTLNPLDGSALSLARLNIPGDVIQGAGGLDFDPTTGILYAVVLRQSDLHRWLAVVDPANELVTPIADTQGNGHVIMDITFDDHGTLWAVTSSEGTDPNSLITVDKVTGAVTYVMGTGGTYPQTIAWNPDNGLLYNMYGSTVALQTIHPVTHETTSVPIIGSPPHLYQPGSLEYDLNARLFVMGELGYPQDFYHLFADGRIEDQGDLLHEVIGMAKLTNDVLNLAAVSSAGVETQPDDNRASAKTTVDAPELVINKTDNPAHVELNAPLTYTLLIENISPYTSTGALVTDTLPAGVTFLSAVASQGSCSHANGAVICPLGTIDPYSNASITIVVTAPNIPGTITNQAVAVDDRIAYSADYEDTLVEPVNLILTKVDDSDPTEGQRPLTYTITVFNSSIYTASGVVVTDTLPPSAIFLNAIPSQGGPCTPGSWYRVICPLGDIGPGASATIEVGANPQGPGDIYNEATVTSINTELISANNTDGEITTVLFPQLAANTIDSPDPADPLSPLTYTISITNTSIYTALGVVMEDTLHPDMAFNSVSASQGGTCSQAGNLVACPLGTINPGASALVTITVTTPITPGVYANLVEATDDRIAYTLDREDTAVAPANLTIIKYDYPEPATVGNPLTYTLVVTNSGPFDALNVVISDTLPDKVVFHSAIPSQGTCTHANSIVTCDIGTLPVLGTASAVIVVTPIDIPPPGVLLSVQKDSSYMRWLVQETGAMLYGGYITVPGQTVLSAYGLDFNPTTQQLYAVLLLTGNYHRWLVHINPENPLNIIGTPIIDTQLAGHEIVDITFDENGTLWAVTGNSGTNPQSLIQIDTHTGVVTPILGTGGTRERQTIAYNLDDGLLYNFYAWSTVEGTITVWHYKLQTIDPLLQVIVSDIPVTGDALLIEGSLQVVGSMTYDMVARNFIMGELDHVSDTQSPAFVRLSTSGVATWHGRMNHAVDGLAISSPVLNNYAFASALNPDLSPGDNVYREPTEPIPHPFAATLGDRVWEDRNGNGIQDNGEPGLAGIYIHLYKQGWGYLNTVVTDANGNYEFKYLIPGATYTVTFELPGGWYFTQPNQGSDDALDSDIDPATGISPLIVPGDSAVITSLDAGIYRLTSVGERAWHDLDLDGIQDASEPGFPDIPVSLYDSENNLIGAATTDSNGTFTFANLSPGVYWLAFQAPSGYGFSPQYQVGPTVDSDADAYGNTALFTLYSAAPDPTRDAGIASHPASDVYYSITPNPVDEGSSVELTGGYYDPDFDDIYTVEIDWGDGFSSPAVVGGDLFDYVFTATHNYTDGDDEHTLAITIEDQFGNSFSEETSLSVRNISPTLTISGAPVASEGVTYTLSISPLNEPGDDTLSACNLDWGDGTPIDNCLAAIGGSIEHAFPDGPQGYTVTLDLQDEDGYYAEVDWITITVSNVAPLGVEDLYPTNEDEVLVVPPPGVLDNDLDVPADPLTATLQTGPAVGSLSFNPDGSFIYTPTQDYNGVAEFTYIASDGLAWSDPTTVTILVGAVNDPPVVNAGVDLAGSEGSLLAFSGSYTDNDLRVGGRTFAHVNAPTITWAFGDGEFATGTLTPTHAYGDNGIYTVTLTVIDDLGGIGADTLLVTVTNATPSLAPLPDLIAAPDVPFDLTIIISDTGWLDTHTLTVTWGDGEEDVFELAAGEYTYQAGHTYDTLAVYTVTVTVQDDDGAADSQPFAITVRTPRVYLPTILAK